MGLVVGSLIITTTGEGTEMAATAASVAAKIPWKQLIVLIPDVTKAAKTIWKQWDSKPKPEPIDPTATVTTQIAAISKRIQALESNELSQSKVVSEVADQLQGIATGLKETAARQALTLWLAIGALTASAVATATAILA